MKLVKFTNCVEGRQSDPIYINIDHITAVYEDRNEGGGGSTKIFGGYTGLLWTVEEGLSEVVKTINHAKEFN